MVKEVEFSNESEVLSDLELYSNAPDQPLYDGYLTDKGTTLNIVVHVPLLNPFASKRKLFLYFKNIDFGSKMVDCVKLQETDFDYRQPGQDVTDKLYQFDLNKVLLIPRKIYSTGGSSEITIELYTYEANLNTDYGSKTLSVPYTVNNDMKYKYDQSTDGIYCLVMADFDPWVFNRSYDIGDIAESNGTLIMSTINNNIDLVTSTSWLAPTDEDIFNFCRGVTKYPPIRAFITDMMISKFAKYKIIENSLLASSFKKYDDESAYELTLLMQNLRERAKYKLLTHKPIDAAYNLQTLKIASSPQTDVTKVNSYFIKYTI